MPLNVPVSYKFVPHPVGPVLLKKRNSRRSRLFIGGTFFRSKEYGEQANQIRIALVDDNLLEGALILQHMVLKPSEMIFANGVTALNIELYKLDLNWDQELWISNQNNVLVARLYGIRWQIGGDQTPQPRQILGSVQLGEIFVSELVSFKLVSGSVPPGTQIILRPRVHRYHLVPTSVTDPVTTMNTIGYDPVLLRDTINNVLNDSWIRMPVRGVLGGGPDSPGTFGEDINDSNSDPEVITPFGITNMGGGDGLPLAPVGFNTGPVRVLILLNYGERENGSLGEINQVFEWVGDSAVLGSWQRY